MPLKCQITLASFLQPLTGVKKSVKKAKKQIIKQERRQILLKTNKTNMVDTITPRSVNF